MDVFHTPKMVTHRVILIGLVVIMIIISHQNRIPIEDESDPVDGGDQSSGMLSVIFM